jgi:hypothetical protein
VNIFTGIFSSLISTGIIDILKGDSSTQIGFIPTVILFIVTTLGLWYVNLRWILPRFYKVIRKEKVNISPESHIVAVERFNKVIMQEVAEINEAVDVMKTTDVAECKRLNFVRSLYKFQEVVNFLYEKFVSDNVMMRDINSQLSPELLRYNFNRYTVSAVMETAKHIRDEMKKLLDDVSIQSLEAYELLSTDFNSISQKLDKTILAMVVIK